MTILASLTCFESGYHGTTGFNRWLDYYGPLMPRLGCDALWLANDGGWVPPDHALQQALLQAYAPMHLSALTPHLGRPSVHCLSGWWRSYLHLLKMAKQHRVRALLLIEWDFFVLSERLIDHIARNLQTCRNATSLWTERYSMPEASLHWMPGDVAIDLYDRLCLARLSEPGLSNTTEYAIDWLPEKQWVGDRYPEWGADAPADADWIGNVPLGTTYRFGNREPVRLPMLSTPARFQYQGLIEGQPVCDHSCTDSSVPVESEVAPAASA